MARAHPAPVVTATQPLSPPPGLRQQRLLRVLREAGRELSARELHQLLEAAQQQQGLATVLLQGFQSLVHTFGIHGLCARCQQLQAPGHG